MIRQQHAYMCSVCVVISCIETLLIPPRCVMDWQKQEGRVYCRNNRFGDAVQAATENWRKEYLPGRGCHLVVSDR